MNLSPSYSSVKLMLHKCSSFLRNPYFMGSFGWIFTKPKMQSKL